MQQITGDTERFGLFSDNITNTETEFHANTPKNKVQMEQLEYETVRDDLQFLSNLCDDDESAVEGGDTLDMTGEEAMQILEEAISAFYVSRSVKLLQETMNFDPTDILFSSFMTLV